MQPDDSKKKEQSCIMKIIIFLFRYKNFAIHGKQINEPVVHLKPFRGSLIPRSACAVVQIAYPTASRESLLSLLNLDAEVANSD